MEDKGIKDNGVEESGGVKVRKEIECACCSDGTCELNPDTVQSDEGDPTDVQVAPPQGHARGPPCQFKTTFNFLM